MLRKSLILQLFDAFSIQRWNDQIRPVPFVEMDKNGHKMAIAYCLAKYEAAATAQPIQWHDMIKAGVFELLRRSVLSDIKGPIYRKIRAQNPDLFAKLSQWVYEQLEPMFANDSVAQDLRAYLSSDDCIDPTVKEILAAAHIYSSYWEFQAIRRVSRDSRAMSRIENMMLMDLARYQHLAGVRKLLEHEAISGFVDLFGQLRFQVRWGQTPRIPMTSVLGHSMMVACLAYLLTRELPAPPCAERLRNNFFGGLFHDLPESVTRDIISPIKTAVPAFAQLISEIEAELVQKEIYPLLESEWHDEFTYYTSNEFKSKIVDAGGVVETSSDEITKSFNADGYRPLDGELIKVCDHLAAFVEAYKSIEAGFSTQDLREGQAAIRNGSRAKKLVAGIRIDSIYEDF